MPIGSHDLYCRGACCANIQHARAEKRLLATMTFHERKAYRIAKRTTGPDQGGA